MKKHIFGDNKNHFYTVVISNREFKPTKKVFFGRIINK